MADVTAPSPSVWLNGRILPAAQPCISPRDHGLLVGDGVYETLVTHGGRPFAWGRHWERLRSSCERLGLALPERDQISGGFAAVMGANGLAEARLRVTVTSGPGPAGYTRGDSGPTVLITASPRQDFVESESLITSPWPRNERGALAGIKSISCGDNERAFAFARERGGGEALILNTRGEICEGTGSNVFLVRDGEALTPPLDSGCLPGVTRSLVIELCRAHGIPVSERALLPAVIGGCNEAFLTSATREVQAIAKIDGLPLPQRPGPVTKRIAELFSGIVNEFVTAAREA